MLIYARNEKDVRIALKSRSLSLLQHLPLRIVFVFVLLLIIIQKCVIINLFVELKCFGMKYILFIYNNRCNTTTETHRNTYTHEQIHRTECWHNSSVLYCYRLSIIHILAFILEKLTKFSYVVIVIVSIPLNRPPLSNATHLNSEHSKAI